MKNLINNKYLYTVLFFLCNYVAFAHDCSSPGDCEETAGYNAVIAMVGGLVALVAGLANTWLPPPTDIENSGTTNVTPPIEDVVVEQDIVLDEDMADVDDIQEVATQGEEFIEDELAVVEDLDELEVEEEFMEDEMEVTDDIEEVFIEEEGFLEEDLDDLREIEEEVPQVTPEQALNEEMRNDVEAFIKKNPRYEAFKGQVINEDGTVNAEVFQEMAAHQKDDWDRFNNPDHKINDDNAFEKILRDQDHLRKTAEGLLDKNPEYERAVESATDEHGIIDRTKLEGILKHRQKFQNKPDRPIAGQWVVDGAMETLRETTTGSKSDGSFSPLGTLFGGLVGVATGGTSAVVTGGSTFIHNVKDEVDKGKDGFEAMASAVKDTAVSEAIGYGVGKGLGKGVDFLKDKFPALTKTVGDAFDELGRLFNKPVSKQGFSELSDDLSKIKDRMRNALAKGDDDAVRALYKGKGMRKLGELEANGHVTPEEAVELNNYFDKETDQAINSGTKEAFEKFESKYGAAPDEVMVGNSGSRGAGRSVKTDADNTNVVSFTEEGLESYAKTNSDRLGLRTEDLFDENMKLKPKAKADVLRRAQQDFTDLQKTEIGNHLKSKGLNPDDFAMESYTGFGSDSGPSDAYPMGYTKSRQDIQGYTEVYKRNSKGDLTSYKTSGRAILDKQDLLNMQMEEGFKMPDLDDSLNIKYSELKPLYEQQHTAMSNYNDVKSVAKSLDRVKYVSGRIGQPMPDSHIVELSTKIRRNPQLAQDILSENGLTEAQFVKQAKEMFDNYKPSL